MTPPAWLPIRYRDFYDVPRLVVFERNDELFLLDSAFDDEADEYSETFTVYRLPAAARALLDADSWANLSGMGEAIGQIDVDAVEFDPTRRSGVSATILRALRIR